MEPEMENVSARAGKVILGVLLVPVIFAALVLAVSIYASVR